MYRRPREGWIRIPAHPVALALIEAAGVPIAAPAPTASAAPVRHRRPRRAHLDGRIDAILDSGPAEVGVESTVIDITAAQPIIYRPGGISREQIESVIGPVRIAAAEIRADAPPESLESARPRHPPLRPARHPLVSRRYARAADRSRATRLTRRACRPDAAHGLAQRGTITRMCRVFLGGIRSASDARRPSLRRPALAHEHQATVIVCPTPPATGIGLAILDRLRKAATPHASGSSEKSMG